VLAFFRGVLLSCFSLCKSLHEKVKSCNLNSHVLQTASRINSDDKGLINRAVFRVVGRRPPTAASRVRSQANPYGICNVKVTLGFPVNMIPPVLHICWNAGGLPTEVLVLRKSGSIKIAKYFSFLLLQRFNVDCVFQPEVLLVAVIACRRNPKLRGTMLCVVTDCYKHFELTYWSHFRYIP
jgi:hypothetical protein